jgi:hypothetical protein
MMLEFTKVNFIPVSVEFNVHAYDPEPDGTYLIQLSNIKMTKIGNPDKCSPLKKKHH